MSLFAIVKALGGELYAGGRRASVPGPGHSAADRSVSLLLDRGRVVVHSFGGADWRGVIDELRRRGLIDAFNQPLGVGALAPEPSHTSPVPVARASVVRRIWALGRSIAGTPGERYFRRRAITRGLPGDAVMRFIREAPISAYAATSCVRPALAVAVGSADGALVGLELTYLTEDGRRARDLRLSRKTIGRVPPSSAVALDPPGPNLLVGEGVATTLSATQRFGLPGWALLSTRNLRHWSPPAGVRAVLIAADRGQDGEASAVMLRRRLLKAGVRARIELPPPGLGDWNDWVVARRAAPIAGKGRSQGEAGCPGGEDGLTQALEPDPDD